MLSSRSHCSAASWAARQASAGRLSEPDDAWPHGTAASGAARRLDAAAFVLFPARRAGRGRAGGRGVGCPDIGCRCSRLPRRQRSRARRGSRARAAPAQRGACRLPCRCSTFRTARALVQIVHVLRDHGERRRMRGQSGDAGARCSAGRAGPARVAIHTSPRPGRDGRGRPGRGQGLRVEARPQPGERRGTSRCRFRRRRPRL